MFFSRLSGAIIHMSGSGTTILNSLLQVKKNISNIWFDKILTIEIVLLDLVRRIFD